MASMARDTRKYKAKKKIQKNREIEACLVDHCHSGRRKKEEAVCVCVSERRKIKLTA